MSSWKNNTWAHVGAHASFSKTFLEQLQIKASEVQTKIGFPSRDQGNDISNYASLKLEKPFAT